MHGDNEEDVPDLWREHYEARVKEAQAQRDAYYRQFYGAPMSEPSPRDTQAETTRWVFHSDGGGWSDVFVDKKYAGRMRTPVAKLAGECVNAHAALVEACRAAMEHIEKYSCSPEARFNTINEMVTAALSKARPKGKE